MATAKSGNSTWSRRRVTLAALHILGDSATPGWPAAIAALGLARQTALVRSEEACIRHHAGRLDII